MSSHGAIDYIFNRKLMFLKIHGKNKHMYKLM